MSEHTTFRLLSNRTQTGSFFPRFQRLDWVLLLICSGIGIWLYHRASAGVNYLWHWQETIELLFTPRADGSLPYFFQGLISTLRLSVWGIVFALILGTLLGLARFSSSGWLRTPANAFIQLVRNIPPLVFVFIFYFFISNQLIPLLGLENLLRHYRGQPNMIQYVLFGPANLWENLASGVICVGLLSSAYIAEVVRGGLQSIDNGQWEAADSLGLSRWVTYRFVIAPQVIKAITPALAGQTISLVKDTSIVSLISIQEMTFVGTEMANSSGYIFEIWLIVGFTYLLICLSLSLYFRYIEKRSHLGSDR
ncbi:ABC transporter permease subunit [Vibrio sp. V27_P1S3P104]|uniref:amino acid ABC transporter permease n=1 Tax=unclassified Vibrio TaxID=2614977 RepID=UPI0013723AE0|nr:MULTISPECIES: amino acid ABC transporter permease [unclassified Vibrio]NAW68027.1 ABC transporter permease subunit [Vibrio sp. V28_P6S34P95]NAX03602.1 ABC transporter permease subunit [Vibrio sp. V30_P3S12P165]NAX35228.1 ABC transporter permease subunit [Vibrio sp. V29_P1S30P107]NAX36694.1 ABC transporter permease subunit [Vibrio sp. V27_P1S3P104]NAX40764.1 ABC transporter permease subunit [Vibrio sp. V26_P1S5P106]